MRCRAVRHRSVCVLAHVYLRPTAPAVACTGQIDILAKVWGQNLHSSEKIKADGRANVTDGPAWQHKTTQSAPLQLTLQLHWYKDLSRLSLVATAIFQGQHLCRQDPRARRWEG